MIKIFTDKVIFYKECPAKGGACACAGWCHEVDFEIPINDWINFIQKYQSSSDKLTNIVEKNSGVFPYGYPEELIKRTGELKTKEE